ncbi:MAG: YceI family protein [Leucobacter sp.]
MQKTQKILIGTGAGVLVLAVAAVIAGPVIYRDFIAAPAAEAPTLSSDDSLLDEQSSSDGDSVSLDPAALSGEWRVAEGSEAGYRVDEVLRDVDVTVTGRTSDVSGTLTIGEDGLTLEAADLAVDVGSIETDASARDAYFRDTAMRVGEHPTATFALTQPVAFTEVPAAGETVQAQASGDLTLAGVTRSVTAEVEVRSDGTTTEIAGSIPIVFADFDIDAPNLGFVQVEPDGFVEFQLNAMK